VRATSGSPRSGSSMPWLEAVDAAGLPRGIVTDLGYARRVGRAGNSIDGDNSIDGEESRSSRDLLQTPPNGVSGSFSVREREKVLTARSGIGMGSNGSIGGSGGVASPGRLRRANTMAPRSAAGGMSIAAVGIAGVASGTQKKKKTTTKKTKQPSSRTSGLKRAKTVTSAVISAGMRRPGGGSARLPSLSQSGSESSPRAVGGSSSDWSRPYRPGSARSISSGSEGGQGAGSAMEEGQREGGW